MLRLVPSTLREAAAALGAPQWKIINFVTLRAARAGIITGVMLAIARISGETAPLLFTSLNNQFWSSDMDQPMANLPVVIFQFAIKSLRRLAESGLGRCAADYLQRADTQYPGACTVPSKRFISLTRLANER